MNSNTSHSIKSSNAPLAFRASGVETLSAQSADDSVISHRVATRALIGMQKEALVAQSDSEVVWRLVCDEGPYLNGTDLAPPPLAFFSAGMASSIASGILLHAKEQGIQVNDLQIVQDNLYSMEGSAVRGTMVAGALPVELHITGSLSGTDESFSALVFEAIARSPIDALMREELVDTFSLSKNGNRLSTNVVAETDEAMPGDPSGLFDSVHYKASGDTLTNCVEKKGSTESVFESDHGVGAAMKDTQKRQLQIRSMLLVRDDGLHEIKVQIFKPIGSVFGFLAEDPPMHGGTSRAPSGLAYVSAGIAFCYMTQLGRYAGILKKNLESYGIVQDTRYDIAAARTLPVVTHTYIQSSEDDETVQKYVDMGEQTCFLHGACRMSNKSKIKLSENP